MPPLNDLTASEADRSAGFTWRPLTKVPAHLFADVGANDVLSRRQAPYRERPGGIGDGVARAERSLDAHHCPWYGTPVC